MTHTQYTALTNTITTEEDLQLAWNNSRRFAIPGSKNFILLVATITATDVENTHWMCTVRILNLKSLQLRRTSMFTKSEQRLVRTVMHSELLGVGGEAAYFNSKYAMHIQKPVVPHEIDIAEAYERADLPQSNGHQKIGPSVKTPSDEDLTSEKS